MNETLQTVFGRKSVRAFTEKEISPEDHATVLKAASSSPTAGNQQLYTILDITDPDLRKRLSETCDHQPFIAEAKMILIFCADCLKWYRAFQQTGCEPRKPGEGDLLLAVSDANIAAQTAVITAESLGIGSCYIGDIMENCEIHRELLRLPPYVFPAAMLVFGYPTEQQKERESPGRAPMEKIVSENVYPEMNEDDFEKLFSWKAKAKGYTEWMKAFCERKYNSGFAREMTRSVREYLKDFSDENE